MNVPDTLPVVVGVADRQLAALDYAAAEALRAGCRVRVVHAYVVPPSAMGSVYGVDVPESFRAGGQEVLDGAVEHLRANRPTLEIEEVLCRGFAPAVLESESAGAQLLVIAPDTAKPWYFRMFEGRVAHRLVEHAACPVLVVPDTWTPAHDAAPVVVMIDGEAGAQGPLSFAFAAAADRGAELHVVHVDPDSAPEHEAEWHAVRRVADTWFAANPRVQGSARVVRGDVRAAAMDVASDAGLLVLGRPRERRMPNLLMDSLAQDLIAAAGCPVAVVPAGYDRGATAG